MKQDDESSAPIASPGWYPSSKGGQRYWDGKTWLDVPEPSASTTPRIPEEAKLKLKPRIIIGVIISTIVLIVALGTFFYLFQQNSGPIKITSETQVAAELTKAGFTNCYSYPPNGEPPFNYAKVSCDDPEDEEHILLFHLFKTRTEMLDWWVVYARCPDPWKFNHLFGENWVMSAGGGSWGDNEGDSQIFIELQKIFGGEIGTGDELLCP